MPPHTIDTPIYETRVNQHPIHTNIYTYPTPSTAQPSSLGSLDSDIMENIEIYSCRVAVGGGVGLS